MTKMTLAEARAHLGLADVMAEKVVRAAALAADIEITDGEENQLAALRKVAADLRKTVEDASVEQRKEHDDEARGVVAEVQALLDGLRGGEPKTPSKKESAPSVRGYTAIERTWMDVDPNIRHLSREDRDDWFRANYELAMMIVGGTRANPTIPTVEASEALKRGWQHHVFERSPEDVPWVSDGNGKRIRAMDTAETGYGLELVGAQYVSDLWAAARNQDSIVGRIRTIPMSAPTTYVPIDGDLPEMLFVGESTSSSATAYTTSKTASNRVTLTAKKFTIQQIWSGEMEEDSIIAFTPFLREKLNMSAALHIGSSMYNGDDTNAGTGNINLDDADPADTKHYLAYDGIRHYWLVTTTGQGKDMAAALNPAEINVARGKLNGADDDVDASVRNINWGQNPRDLLLVADWSTYMAMLDIDTVKTVDKYGPQATVVTGELANFSGIPIVSPGYATKTEADGKASTTETNNTKGQISVFNPGGFLAGSRRDVQLFFDRIQRTDQFLFELYTRRAFTRFGANVSAGIYDISL